MSALWKPLLGMLVLGALGCSTPTEPSGVLTTTDRLINDGEQKVVASDPAENARFGNAVAMSANFAVVGSALADNRRGAAFVFERSGPAWTLRQRLSAPEAGQGRFGASVAVSGSRIAIGAPEASPLGAVYIFEHDGRIATLRQKVAGTRLFYGTSVALEGDVLAVGDRESISILERAGASFTQTQHLPRPPNGFLGHSLALSGNTLLFGVDLSEQSAAEVYVRPAAGASWQFQQRLVAVDAHAFDRFGSSVALSGDTALIGAYDESPAFGRFGAAYVFGRSGSLWTQQQKLTPGDKSAGDQFGIAVALAGDVAVVGAHGDDGEAGDQGSSYVFTRSAAHWAETRKLAAFDAGDRDNFGSAVAATPDFALIGSPNDDIPFRAQGSAYFFRLESPEVPPGEVCLAGCSSDFHCPTGQYCESSGLCLAQKARGRACEAADCRQPNCAVCATGFCVDGFCCDQACTDPDSACSSVFTGQPAGTCAPALEGEGGSASGGSAGTDGTGGAGGSGGTGGASSGAGGSGTGGASGTGGSGSTPIPCFGVSPDGDDALAQSTLGAMPFRTVQAAIDFAAAHREVATRVCIASGNNCGITAEFSTEQGSDLVMRDGISVFGRYESIAWKRCSDSVTRLKPSAGRGVVFGSDVTTETELNGVEIWPWQPEQPAASIGAVLVAGARGVKIVDVTMPEMNWFPLPQVSYGVQIDAQSEVTIERSRIFARSAQIASAGVYLFHSRLLVADSSVTATGAAARALQIDDPLDVRVLHSTLSAHGQSSDGDVGVTQGVDALGNIGVLVIEDSLIEARGAGQAASGVSSASTNGTGVVLRRNLVRVEGNGSITGMSLVGGGAIVESNEVDCAGTGFGQAVGIHCDGFGAAASCRNVVGNTVSAPRCSGSCAYDSTALIVAGMGTLVESNQVDAGCSSGATWSSAVGLRASGDVRVQNNVLTGASCGAPGQGVRGVGVLIDSAAGTVDLHSNYLEGGGASASGCVTAGVKLVAGESILRNNIIVPGTCEAAFNIDQDGAPTPGILSNNAFAPGAGLYRIIGALDPQTIAEVNALPGASDNFTANDCRFPLEAGSTCVGRGVAEAAPEHDFEGDLRDARPDVGPDEVVVSANPCEPNPCQNGASCIAVDGETAACACVDGFLGAHCTYRLGALESGYFHNCGLRSHDSSVECWGGWPASTSPPAGSFLDLALGNTYSCGVRGNAAVDSAGPVECWGFLDGHDSPPAGRFRTVDSLGFSCGIRDDGTVACWDSDNLNGELAVPSGIFESVAVGGAHACALGGGVIACWGSNASGQASPPPGLFAQVSSGSGYSCGRRIDGTLACWGSNQFGQISAPAGRFVALGTGDGHACALSEDGRLSCWGSNFFKESVAPAGTFSLGASLAVGSNHACIADEVHGVSCWGRQEAGQSTPRGGLFRTVSAGGARGCGLTVQGTLMCWYEEDLGHQPPPVSDPFIDISLGGLSCGIRTDGTLSCWASNGSVRPAPSGSFTAVSVGNDHACALRPDQTVACWGSNFRGQASPPSGAFSLVTAAGDQTCGLRVDGRVACWGDNRFGQTAVPPGLFEHVSTSVGRTCGVQRGGTISCWGRPVRTPIPGGTFKQVAVGLQHACAIRDDDSIVCWSDDFPSDPALVAPPGPFRFVGVGSFGNTCAIRPNLLLECFGIPVY